MGEPARQLAAAPSLDALAADPGASDMLSHAEASVLLGRALSVVGVLQAQLMRQAVLDTAGRRSRERLLSTADVAERLHRSVSWVEKNLHNLPPRRALGGTPGWREADIDALIRSAPPYRGSR